MLEKDNKKPYKGMTQDELLEVVDKYQSFIADLNWMIGEVGGTENDDTPGKWDNMSKGELLALIEQLDSIMNELDDELDESDYERIYYGVDAENEDYPLMRKEYYLINPNLSLEDWKDSYPIWDKGE